MSTPSNNPDALEERIAALRRLPRATPERDLLPGVLARIARPDARVVSLAEWRAIAVAAVLVFVLNLLALYYHTRAAALPADDAYALLTDFQLYD